MQGSTVPHGTPQKLEKDGLGNILDTKKSTAPSTNTSNETLCSMPPFLDHVLDLFETQAVGAMGIFVVNSSSVIWLRVIHGLQKFPGFLDQGSPNKPNAFGYLDDIVGDTGELARVKADMLSKTLAP
eukprot:jgi/Psemu1/49102/gm1.49102_g